MEKPILFKNEMVQAILAGRKTMTRRIIKPKTLDRFINLIWNPNENLSLSPYQVGDILWVKETWWADNKNWAEARTFLHKADAPFPDPWSNDFKWRSSRYMPRIAARLFLKVKDVRVERLQDITEGDARSEGIEWTDEGPLHAHYLNHNLNASLNFKTSKEAFSSLWDSINKSRGFSWDSNPYVWIISFERVEGK